MRGLYRARLLLNAVVVAGAVVLAPRANVTRVDNDITAWFSRDDPLYRDYERFRAEFGGTQPLVVAIRSESPDPAAPSAGLFTRERLAWLKQVTDDLERIRSVHRVQSLANTHILRAVTGGAVGKSEPDDPSLDYQPLVDPERRSPERTRALAVSEPNIRGQLVFSIDLDGSAPDDVAAQLADEITLPADGEFEVAYRDGVRYVPRLQRVRPEQLPLRTFNAVASDGRARPFQLQTQSPGVLSNLALHETQRIAPGPDEVEVRVLAAGINFRDVMKALGTHPGHPDDLLWFGDDLSGIVERVGERVTAFRPGDEVAGMARHTRFAPTRQRMPASSSGSPRTCRSPKRRRFPPFS